ncbi:hypothetical protein GCM10028778_19200 [Barrientosiimonas marina]|uniref:EAL domain-containing protein n=1 Tax=Lentibacillus kimchii TaxID=1542911 RepID=A0ABW2UQ32_9BACI
MSNLQHNDEAKKNAEFVSSHLKIGMWQKDYTWDAFEYVSEGISDILAHPVQELYDNPDLWKDLIHPADKDSVLQTYDSLQTGDSLDHHYRILRGDGSVRWVFDQTIKALNDDGRTISLFGTLTDITPEVDMRRKLKHLSSYDALTSLPNRQSLYDKLDTFCSRHTAEPFALLHIDLDRLQLINDSLGYITGDKLLQETTRRLLSVLPAEAYLAHVSNNDFIVLMAYASKTDATQAASRIIKTLKEPFQIEEDDLRLHVTASIGISFYPSDGEKKLLLLRNAHNALSYAKELGKNNYQLYEASQEFSSSEKLILEEEMRQAIANEDFKLYYQPLVDASTGAINGAEALLRWYHAERGFVSPGEFVPLAEENHLIHEIGSWVIQTVCQQLRAWMDQGLPMFPVAINVSPIQFMNEELVAFIEEQLNTYNIPAKYLKLEITEGSLLRNEKTVLDKLQRLSNLGIKIAIDDFGTGFSSLMHLKKFSPDIIKIDKGFVQSIGNEQTIDAAITSTVLHLAQELNMTVIAEGVEEHVQLDFLRDHHCEIIQGFLFSKPVPVETFEQMLADGYLKPAPPQA